MTDISVKTDIFLLTKRGIFKSEVYITTNLSTSETISINETLSCNHWNTTMLDE